MNNFIAAPFVKWVGGKRQLLMQIKYRIPKEYNRYFEPFVGGGAVVFALAPKNVWINDINEALINSYLKIRDTPVEFLNIVDKIDREMWEDGKEYYYLIRERYNKKLSNREFDTELAAMFVFLNKHCFNGLYRVNSKGLFNVPYNNSRRVSCDKDSILAVSKKLQRMKITVGDFEKASMEASEGDFIFFDSPYAPLNSTSFEAYTKEGFDIESHKRLAALYDKLTQKGVFCMLTNHNTEFINDLYGKKGYRMDVVSVKRMINSDATKRTGEEIIICNY